MSDKENRYNQIKSLRAFLKDTKETRQELKKNLNISLYQKLPEALKLYIWEYNHCHMPAKNYIRVMREFKSNFAPFQYHCRGNFVMGTCRNLYDGIADYRSNNFKLWNEGFGLIKINIYDKKYDKMFNSDSESDKNNDSDDNEEEAPYYSYYCSEKCIEKTVQLQKKKIKNDLKKYGKCFKYQL
tara:strand:+ start:715 stop:1266 length:552 start_codon:yes stop_codon:yes gene_type:complete